LAVDTGVSIGGVGVGVGVGINVGVGVGVRVGTSVGVGVGVGTARRIVYFFSTCVSVVLRKRMRTVTISAVMSVKSHS
jgi:hypothetical protein